MFAALTGAGLSAAAGLNAYIPFLIVAVMGRLDVLTLPSSYSWIESWWAMSIGAILLITEVVLDKIPAVDSINDMVGTAVRPIIGGVVFTASESAKALDHSSWMADHPWVGAIGGALLAGSVHTVKATARPLINLGTAGFGAPVVSSVEDASSTGLSFIAIFIPIFVVVALLAFVAGGYYLFKRLRRAPKLST